jgi:peroxiredoxin
MLQAGEMAPDFDLPVLIGGVKKRFRLSESLGKQNVVLAFYPLNWEPVSARQMVACKVEREQFRAQNAEIVGISVDSIMNTTAWEREIGPFDYPLCSDFWPHGEITRRYGVLRDREPFAGASERAIFIINKTGRIEFSKIYPINQVPDREETLKVLRDLYTSSARE